jgi:hypothetical protein
MYETIDSTTRAGMVLPADALAKFDELSSRIEARSLIVWGEHCSECSYPTCYTSCAFYTPRRDGHCRRFANGIEQAAIGDVVLGRIKFRKWPKLEGTGSVELFPVRTARFRERSTGLRARVRYSADPPGIGTGGRLWRPSARDLGGLTLLSWKHGSNRGRCFLLLLLSLTIANTGFCNLVFICGPVTTGWNCHMRRSPRGSI